MSDTRELYPAEMIDGKPMYHYYTPTAPRPVIEDDAPAVVIQGIRLLKCECCGFRWIESEMAGGLCPACLPVSFSPEAEPGPGIEPGPATADMEPTLFDMEGF